MSRSPVLITIAQACKRHGLSPYTAHRRIKSGHLRAVTYKSIYFVEEREFSAFVKALRAGYLNKSREDHKEYVRVDEDALCKLHAEGMTNVRIAAALNVTEGAVSRVLKRLGLKRQKGKPMRRMGRPLWEVANPDQFASVREMRESGMPLAKIARFYDVSTPTLKAVFARNKIEPRWAPRWARENGNA